MIRSVKTSTDIHLHVYIIIKCNQMKSVYDQKKSLQVTRLAFFVLVSFTERLHLESLNNPVGR